MYFRHFALRCGIGFVALGILALVMGLCGSGNIQLVFQ